MYFKSVVVLLLFLGRCISHTNIIKLQPNHTVSIDNNSTRELKFKKLKRIVRVVAKVAAVAATGGAAAGLIAKSAAEKLRWLQR